MRKAHIAMSGLLVLIAGISVMNIGEKNASAMAAADDKAPPTPSAALDSAEDGRAALPQTPAQPIARAGETLLEQAIFDAFPETDAKSPAEKKKMAEASDFVAAAINLNGHLCARPVEMMQAGAGLYGIGCIARRDGQGRANYLVNTKTAEVSPI